MKKSIIFAACVLCMLSESAYAKTLLNKDTASGALVLSGNAETERVKSFASFAVIPYGMNVDGNVIQNNFENVFYKTVQTDNDGNFKTEFSLPDNMSNGQYSVISYGADGKSINRFGLINGDFSAELAGINSASDTLETYEALKGLSSYAVDGDTLEKWGKAVSEYLCRAKTDNGYNADTFVKAYNMGEALARLEAEDISLGNMLCEYSAYTEVSYSDTYEKLTETGRAEAEKLIKREIPSVSGNFAEVYQRIFEISEMKGSKSAKELEENYLNSAKQRNRSLSEYNSLSSYKRENVFLVMLSSIEAKNSLNEIDALFDECVREQKTDGGNRETGGGTGGGGGGGSSAANRGTSSPVKNSVPVKSSPNTTENTKKLSDINGHWAESDIRKLYEKGIVNGFEDGNFYPDNAVTRAEFVKIMCGMFGLSGNKACSFNDVSSNDWFYAQVCAAESHGLITGNDNGSFVPLEAITREDAAVIIQRLIKAEITQNIEFADSHKISDYALEAIKALAGKGIMNGYGDNTINPKGRITRAETAAIILRAAELK